jgi:hypothetical protein
MALSAQDKILYVANKLGLTTLKNMQGSTGAVYDIDRQTTGTLFANASQKPFPDDTNLSSNRFEVNEALLVETIGFFIDGVGLDAWTGNINANYAGNTMVLFDLIIGNKKVMKETPIWTAGQPNTFASTGFTTGSPTFGGTALVPRHQIFLEGAGILIPPQVEFQLEYKFYNVQTGLEQPIDPSFPIGCYLYGTKVNLNFNTTL